MNHLCVVKVRNMLHATASRTIPCIVPGSSELGHHFFYIPPTIVMQRPMLQSSFFVIISLYYELVQVKRRTLPDECRLHYLLEYRIPGT